METYHPQGSRSSLRWKAMEGSRNLRPFLFLAEDHQQVCHHLQEEYFLLEILNRVCKRLCCNLSDWTHVQVDLLREKISSLTNPAWNREMWNFKSLKNMVLPGLLLISAISLSFRRSKLGPHNEKYSWWFDYYGLVWFRVRHQLLEFNGKTKFLAISMNL